MALHTSGESKSADDNEDVFLDYLSRLEERLASRSDELEEVHMEAAIDSQLTETSRQSTDNPLVLPSLQESPLFVDYTNPNAVPNCLSPYVPTEANRIAALLRFARIISSDMLLDIGCGDGRVCVAASKLTGCQAIGVDLSPPCIQLARQLAKEEGDVDCEFIQADATLDPSLLLSDDSPLNVLRNVTCVFLYTYPTLLHALTPLLEQLTSKYKATRVITLTYHLDDRVATVTDINDEFDFRLYSHVRRCIPIDS